MRSRSILLVLATTTASAVASLALGESGEITPERIEVDGDMFRNNPALGTVDWVDDPTDPNTGTDCLADGGIAMCNQANVTARAGGTGTWHGVRIIDGLGDNDDSFLGGSKFDDLTSWTVGIGNVGSTKNDADEVFLANNTDTLYFAMNREGNNGTTAFDFEFNQLAPNPADQADPDTPYIPNRSIDDIMLVFELSGSGKTGSVAIFAYRWTGAAWAAIAVPAAVERAINDAEVTGPPWGNRDSKGVWGNTALKRLTFAEVGLPIGPGGIELPVDDGDCSQSAWVSIRTRASNQFTSDMKDAFEIVEYQFSGLTVAAAKTAESAANLTMTATGMVDASDPDLQWEVFNTMTQAWQPIVGETGMSLVLAHDDPEFSAPLTSTTLLETPLGVAGGLFIGQKRTTQVRLSASVTVNDTTCTLESNPVALTELLLVDP